MRLAREDEREVAISVPENRARRAQARASELAVVLWAKPRQAVSRARCARSRRGRSGRRARSPCACRSSIPTPALQWGMTANVGVAAAGRRDAALLPLTSIYQTGRQARGVGLRSRDAAGRAARRWRSASIARTACVVALRAVRTASGSSRPACTSCTGPDGAAVRRRPAPRTTPSPARDVGANGSNAQLIAYDDSARSRRRRAGARFNLSEWALHHRALVLYLIVVFALAGVFCRTSSSASPRIRRSRSR